MSDSDDSRRRSRRRRSDRDRGESRRRRRRDRYDDSSSDEDDRRRSRSRRSRSRRSDSESDNDRRRSGHRRHRSSSSKKKSKRKDKRRDRRDGIEEAARRAAIAQARAQGLSVGDLVEDGLDGKRRRKLEKKAKLAVKMLGYDNENNPFGDSELHKPFVWKKKLEGEVAAGHRPEASASAAEMRDQRASYIDEIRRVRERREEAEREREDRERMRREEELLREAEEYGNWEAREDAFVSQQQRVRSAIRIRDGRERPIDVLAKNFLLWKAGEGGDGDGDKLGLGRSALADALAPDGGVADEAAFGVTLDDPHVALEGLSLQDLQQLLQDMQSYHDAEADEQFRKYWSLLLLVCRDHIHREQARAVGSTRTGIGGTPQAVQGDVEEYLGDRSLEELQAMRPDVEKRAKEGVDGDRRPVDADYWDAVNRALQVFLARAELAEIHADMLTKRLQQLEDAQAARGGPVADDDDDDDDADGGKEEQERGKAAAAAPAAAAAAAAAAAGGGSAAAAGGGAGDRALQGKSVEELAAAGAGDSEELLQGGTVDVDTNEMYLWQDKYRPRKPRFYNRVKTGYSWNSYNKAHYDYDNPPPKTVQGYRFNIFYPDLIDKSQTPQWFLEPADNPDFAIIRFHAGPPYEDIAFQIPNRKWLSGRKSGFRSTFVRGMLQVSFNFESGHWRK